MALVFVNGELVAAQDAVVSVFDHGIIVGDGVFETILLQDGRPFALARHLARLARSAHGLGIEAVLPEAVRDAVLQVIETCEFPTGRIRITVTSGNGPLASARGASPFSLFVAAEPAEIAREPTDVVVVPWTRNEKGAVAGLKTTSYAENALAIAHAYERGASEAIFANTVSQLCEGTGSNVFVVKDGDLLTPPLASGCLAGTTRELVLEHHGGSERDIPFTDFAPSRIEEAFLTSSMRGVQPIRAIDGVALAEAPGAETKRAMKTFADLLTAGID